MGNLLERQASRERLPGQRNSYFAVVFGALSKAKEFIASKDRSIENVVPGAVLSFHSLEHVPIGQRCLETSRLAGAVVLSELAGSAQVGAADEGFNAEPACVSVSACFGIPSTLNHVLRETLFCFPKNPHQDV